MGHMLCPVIFFSVLKKNCIAVSIGKKMGHKKKIMGHELCPYIFFEELEELPWKLVVNISLLKKSENFLFKVSKYRQCSKKLFG